VSGDLDALDTLVRTAAGDAGLAWLDEALASVRTDPAAVRAAFPVAGRTVGRERLGSAAEDGARVTRADEGARVLLVAALFETAPPATAARELRELYDFGDGEERAALLKALNVLDPEPGGEIDRTGLGMLADAMRSHDTRQVAAGLGAYGLKRLADDDLRQAVLKAVFMGVPLAPMTGLPLRADAELARMLAGYALERVAAGRSVPADIWPLIQLAPPEAELAAIEAELQHPVEERRRAAAAALTDRDRVATGG
jgi:hypothetical protein